MNQIDIVFSFLNQYCFKSAKDNIELLSSYFRRNVPGGRVGNPLLFDLLDTIKFHEFEDIDVPMIQELMIKENKTPAEASMILQEIMKYKSYTKEQTIPTRRIISDLCSSAILNRATELFANEPTKQMEYIKKSNVQVDVEDLLLSKTFLDLDENTMVADSNIAWKTPWPEINDCFQPIQGWSPALYCVSSAPGIGKSLCLHQLAVCMAGQGAKVHILVLGDLSEKDLCVRMASIVSGEPFEVCAKNLKESLGLLRRQFGDRISMTVMPSAVVSPEQYIEFIKDGDFDILIVDYDGNFKNDRVLDSMYLAGGELYDSLTLLSKEKVVIVASQPKVYSWNQEIIGLGDLSESSRKAHIIDFLLTFSRAPGSNQACGIMNIAKNRRGRVGDKFYYVRLNNGRFKIIPKGVYEYIKDLPEHHEWSDSEIDRLVDGYKAQLTTINNTMATMMPQQGGPVGSKPQLQTSPKKTVKNPFT